MSGTEYEPKKNINRKDLISEIMRYRPQDKAETAFIGMFLTLLGNPRCFYRDCFPGHITGSAIVIDPTGRFILLNRHKLLDKWLGFGGHADGDEDILRVALRETVEESGLTKLKLLQNGFVDLDIHKIPANAKRNEPEHYHYDIRYVFQLKEDQRPVVSDESVDLRWVSFAEAYDLVSEGDSLHRLIVKAETYV